MESAGRLSGDILKKCEVYAIKACLRSFFRKLSSPFLWKLHCFSEKGLRPLLDAWNEIQGHIDSSASLKTELQPK
jgi:hypothetical protein